MAVKSFRPITPSRRQMTVATFDELTTDKPERSLIAPLKKRAGRNHQGRLTVRHQGGGHKRMYRIIDFKRNKDGVPAKVATIEYDPNRTCYIALLNYVDGEKTLYLGSQWPEGGGRGGPRSEADIKIGNALPLANIPVGTIVHNIELKPQKGGQIVRSAGASAQLMAKEDKYASLRLPSGEVRKILMTCRATIASSSNLENDIINIGKAGRSRWMNKRPANRGVVMNPCDHPHGGGEGRSPVGRKRPVTPWGKSAIGGNHQKEEKSQQ